MSSISDKVFKHVVLNLVPVLFLQTFFLLRVALRFSFKERHQHLCVGVECPHVFGQFFKSFWCLCQVLDPLESVFVSLFAFLEFLRAQEVDLSKSCVVYKSFLLHVKSARLLHCDSKNGASKIALLLLFKVIGW